MSKPTDETVELMKYGVSHDDIQVNLLAARCQSLYLIVREMALLTKFDPSAHHLTRHQRRIAILQERAAKLVFGDLCGDEEPG